METQSMKYIDYKNVEFLKKHLNPHGRMYSRKKTGFSGKTQRKLATAIKRARFMGLLPYIAE
ncbi:MAG: 30S ribosomal protein S18 [Candidatus Paceibacterota bacterium]